jgi:hypothetical protein
MSAPGEAVQAVRPHAAQLAAGALAMLVCAALVDLWFCWPAGADMDAYEYLVYLAVLGTFTVFWYLVLLLVFPRLQRTGPAAGLLTAVLVDLSIVLLGGLAYWAAASHPESPSSTNAILGLELAYVFAYLMIFLMFVSWRVLIVYALGGWIARRLMSAVRPSRSRP